MTFGAGAATGLDVRDLTLTYPHAAQPAVDGVTFYVAPGRTLSLVGPSGAGKSTILRAICGLVKPDSGQIRCGERVLDGLSPQARRTAMVFASDALVRTMSVRENLELVAGAARGRALELARALDVAQHLEKRPAMLSTGERQRVSIARAVLSNPDVLLLDEPLAPLDPDLRLRVREEILSVRGRFSGPIVFVTHDHSDAMAVGDDLAVLMDGRIEDAGHPQRVYDRPATLRAARFLGARPMNVVGGAAFGSPERFVAFRPERAFIGGDTLGGTVERIERAGADAYVHVRAGDETVAVRVPVEAIPAPGARISVGVRETDRCYYDRNTGGLVG